MSCTAASSPCGLYTFGPRLHSTLIAPRTRLASKASCHRSARSTPCGAEMCTSEMCATLNIMETFLATSSLAATKLVTNPFLPSGSFPRYVTNTTERLPSQWSRKTWRS